MPVTQEDRDGITYVCITNNSGVELSCISVGATITELTLPDGTDIVLGFKDAQDYRTNTQYLGCTVGRVANRIRDATFSLDGESYHVSPNKAPHTLHGGEVGFNRANWCVSAIGEDSVTFRHESPSGDMGYPGTVIAKATYTLAENGEVKIDYEATTRDKPTIVNIVNHTYFNLAQKGTIHQHILQINATTYTPLDDQLIAIGTLESLPSNLDFATPTAIGLRMGQGEGQVDGYDINYNVKEGTIYHPQDHTLRLCATLLEPVSNHEVKVYSDQPGVQLYTGKFLDGSYVGKDGTPIGPYEGVCLETQAWPNAANNPVAQSQVVLRPGDTYRSKTVWTLK